MIYRRMHVLEWQTVYALTRGSFWCLFCRVVKQRWELVPKQHSSETETVRHESTYIILFLIWHKESINGEKTTIFTHRPRISFARFTFYWWHHNRLLMTSQWPDSYDASTWHMISNSIDIGFIYANIHDQSRKRLTFFPECPIQGKYLFVDINNAPYR